MIYEHIRVRMGKNVLLQVKIVSVQKLLFKTTEAINFRRFDHEKIRKKRWQLLNLNDTNFNPGGFN